jgi:demethoxyubiquinone hydroxylase (CLK1/Coq7/Cat5 family)
MDTRKILFEKFEDVLALEYKIAEIYDECLHLSEDIKIISTLSKIRDDELRHGSMARRLLEITQG